MNQELAQAHKATNALHSLVLLAGMGLVLLLLGYSLAGTDGALVAAFSGLFLLWFSPRIAPQLVMRLYGARPIGPYELGDLHRIVVWLTRRAELPGPPRLYYVPSRVMNAFTVGDRNQAAIGITDGLLRALDLRELTGVLAHEMTHVRNNDLRVMMLADIIARVTSILSFFGQILLLINLPMLLFGQAPIPWLAILILLGAPTVSLLLQLALSRSREFDADLGAVELTGDAVGLASALEKMERYQRSLLDLILAPGRRIPDPSTLRTHPNTQERIERLLELAEAEAPQGERVPVHGIAFALPESLSRVPRDPRWHMTGLWF